MIIFEFEVKELIVITDFYPLGTNGAWGNATGFYDKDETFREPLRVTRSMRFHLAEKRRESDAACSEHHALGEFSA